MWVAAFLSSLIEDAVVEFTAEVEAVLSEAIGYDLCHGEVMAVAFVVLHIFIYNAFAMLDDETQEGSTGSRPLTFMEGGCNTWSGYGVIGSACPPL